MIFYLFVQFPDEIIDDQSASLIHLNALNLFILCLSKPNEIKNKNVKSVLFLDRDHKKILCLFVLENLRTTKRLAHGYFKRS